jgi:hypothetical protein
VTDTGGIIEPAYVSPERVNDYETGTGSI